ncbi:MAG: VOC family protein [Candidatus Eremiobacteraeota bacterium]|nr:VOC family protein [Candidatus Eremiobacteraeota bacterium]
MSVHSLASYALRVPDLEAGRRFYETLGLVSNERDGILGFRCSGLDDDQVRLVEGARKRLDHLRFGADETGLGAIRARMRAAGVEEADPPHDALGDGLWLRDPDGNAVNVRPAQHPSPRTAPERIVNSPGNYRRIGFPGCPPRGRVSPYRLGHVVLQTPQLEEMLAFYRDVLGLALSDRCQRIIAFLHVPQGGDHHVLAFASAERRGFHHASFEVGSIDEIGMGAQTVLQAGYRDGWGLGRHVIGANLFHYLRDPWNSMAEYYCDMDQIPGDGSWQPRNYPPEDAQYRWGPHPPPDFDVNFEEPD